MKLAPLLAKFLYAHLVMDLPGLGRFRRNDQPIHGETATLSGVTFESDPGIRDSPELVAFISAETGKMKALATADLASYLELAKQFLNIGKPYYFEGIGSLTKQRNGEYLFNPGPVLPEVLFEKEENTEASPVNDGPRIDYKKILYAKKLSSRGAKTSFLIAGILGLMVAIWGGYSIYRKKSSQPVVDHDPVETTGATTAVMFTEQPPAQEIIVPSREETPATVDAKKFILEKARSKRAFERYQRLKSYQWKVEMETSDSVLYTLYVRVPASNADTTRIIDSLTRMNGKRVQLEN